MEKLGVSNENFAEKSPNLWCLLICLSRFYELLRIHVFCNDSLEIRTNKQARNVAINHLCFLLSKQNLKVGQTSNFWSILIARPRKTDTNQRFKLMNVFIRIFIFSEQADFFQNISRYVRRNLLLYQDNKVVSASGRARMLSRSCSY